MNKLFDPALSRIKSASHLIRLAGGCLICITLWVSVQPADAQATTYDWLQWGGGPQHTENNTQEHILTLNNVPHLRQLFKVQLPDAVDGVPVYLRHVKTPRGTADVLFMTSMSGDLYAVDAHSGGMIWVQHHNVPSCYVDGGDPAKIPQKLACWSTSIPAIDPSLNYVYSYGLDGYVHKHQVTDGTEINGNGWPELVTRKPWLDKVSSALTIATAKNGVSYLYATTSGYPKPLPGDWGDYQGHLTTINLTTGEQIVFNVMCSSVLAHFVEQPGKPSCPDTKGGIWARGGVTYIPDLDLIFLSTGNGKFSPTDGDWGESVLALKPDGSGSAPGAPVDSYTPTNFQELADKDQDLAVYSPMPLPVPQNSKYPHLLIQGAKNNELYLLNGDDLSGKHEPGQTGGELAPLATISGRTELTNSPAIWVNPTDNSTWIFTPTYLGVSAWKLNFDKDGQPGLDLIWKNVYPCTTPLVANNVLYCAAFKNVWAFNPLTGEKVWGVYPIGDIHWQSPLVVNGVLYITDLGNDLIAYGL